MNIRNNEEQRKRIRRIIGEKTPESNRMIAKILLFFAGVSFVFFLLFAVGILKSNSSLVHLSMILLPFLFIAVGGWCLYIKGRSKAFPYLFILLFAFFWFALELMSGYKSKLLLPILVVLSMRYYNWKFILFSYLVSVAVLFASVWCSAYLYAETGFLDLNLVSFEMPQTAFLDGFIYNDIINLSPSSRALFINGLRLSFLPNLVMLSMGTFVVLRFMDYNLSNLLKAQEMAEEAANRHLELSDMKTKVMLSQIRPHFLYNTLTTITALCTIDPEKAAKLTMDFSDYLRNNLDALGRTESMLIPFETELEHIRKYLNIELVRFEDTLKVEYDTPEMLFSVPVLSIQPIVENAVKHGICQKPAGGTVKITTRKVKDGHEIIISDDGVGFDGNEVQNDGRTHIGIENVKKRVSLIGGTVKIESRKNAGTAVTVFVPLQRGLVK